MRDLHAFSASQNSASTYALVNLVQNLPRDRRVADQPFHFPYQGDHAIHADRWYMYMKSLGHCADASLLVWRAG